MQLEEVTAEIRPRSDWEAVDLGFAMVRRNFWRCFVVWWLPLLVPLLIFGWLLRDLPMLLLMGFWWVKPAGSRMVLFELSRRLFGEKPGWKSIFKELPKAWWRRFFYRFCWARFSPWMPVLMAVEDLENLRGKAYRQRANQLARRGDGVVMWIYFLNDATAGWLGVILFALAVNLLPEGQEQPWRLALETWDQAQPFDFPLLISWTATVCLMLAMSLTDLFVTGAGFGIYVNNRTWLEGWDVELAFKRLGQRLGKIAALLVLTALFFTPMTAHADETVRRNSDAELMEEVKADKDFTVHFVMDRVPKDKPARSSSPSWLEKLFSRLGGGGMENLGWLFAVSLGVLLLGLLAWAIWKNRHALSSPKGWTVEERKKPLARVVMGMAVSAESLPADVPASAWELWQQGRKHEALGLLYRGAIFKVMDGGLDIHESDTEGDCLRRVQAGAKAHASYFRGLTNAWMSLAYAGREPAAIEVESLCREWPFSERRAG